MPDKSDEYVRFYFGVSVSCLIPTNPHGKSGGVSNDKWEKDHLDAILGDLKAKLSKNGFEVSYRKHVPVDGAQRIYAAEFVVAALHPFPAAQIFTPRKGYSGFSVRKKPFAKAKTILEMKITDSLKRDYVVNIITYEYAASRAFVFEVYLGGYLELKHVISSREISDAEGSVRQAIGYFNDQVVDEFTQENYDVYPRMTRRRPKNNVYEFELSSTRHFGFSENKVFGDLILMEENMPLDQAEILGIDCDDEALTELISSEREQFESRCLECLPPDTDLIGFTLDFVDYDEGIFDYSNDLV